VTWNAYPSGGNGTYTFSWSGSDNIYGTGQVIYTSYNNPGLKFANVTVYSNGQAVTQSCNNSVNISYTYVNVYPQNNYNYVQPYPVYNVPIRQSLDIGCIVDPTRMSVNSPVTWSAEVTGGFAPYTYSWTGSEGLNGNQNSIIKYYGTPGEKSAIVTVTSADGKTGVRACSNTATIINAPVPKPIVRTVYVQPTPTPPVVQAPVSNDQQTALQANTIFSVANIPWGWVAFLVILVLFGTVLYLLFNKAKI
jgi:hypothetical protein